MREQCSECLTNLTNYHLMTSSLFKVYQPFNRATKTLRSKWLETKDAQISDFHRWLCLYQLVSNKSFLSCPEQLNGWLGH